MNQRGKKSASALSVVSEIRDMRPRAPEELNADQAEVWKRIVDTKPHDWFTPDSYDLLVAYCRNVVASRTLAGTIENVPQALLGDKGELEKFAKLNRLKDMHEGRASQLATKMRLTQQARYDTKTANTAHKNTAKKKIWE